MAGFTTGQLQDKTVAELRQMCGNMGITGMSKQRKDNIVSEIMRYQRAQDRRVKREAAKKTSTKTIAGPTTADIAPASPNVSALKTEMTSVMTKPSARRGDKATTTLRVSAGASSGEFPVVGKTVGAVSEFLREVLNVDTMAQGIVNGKTAESGYVLKSGDNLEFIKPAGQKG